MTRDCRHVSESVQPKARPALFFEAIDGGALDVPYLQMKGKAIAQGNFEASFALKLAAKDARLAVEAAERRELDLPVLEAISERMQQGVPEQAIRT